MTMALEYSYPKCSNGSPSCKRQVGSERHGRVVRREFRLRLIGRASQCTERDEIIHFIRTDDLL